MDLGAATAAQAKADSDLKDAKLSAAADVVSHVVGGSQGGGALTALVHIRKATW